MDVKPCSCGHAHHATPNPSTLHPLNDESSVYVESVPTDPDNDGKSALTSSQLETDTERRDTTTEG